MSLAWSTEEKGEKMLTQEKTFDCWLAEWQERLAGVQQPAVVVGKDYQTCGHCRTVGELGQQCPGCGRLL